MAKSRAPAKRTSAAKRKRTSAARRKRTSPKKKAIKKRAIKKRAIKKSATKNLARRKPTKKRATKRATKKRAPAKSAKRAARARKLEQPLATAARAKAPTRAPTIKPKRRMAAPQPSSQGLAFRLSEHVRPSSYRLHVSIDPQLSRDYFGEVEIDLDLTRACTSLELHAVDLTIERASLRVPDADAASVIEAMVDAHPERETINITPETKLPTGTVSLRIAFSGKLRSDLRGFYAASSGERKYAFTQLEAADARRFFPCFDEPSFKARFTLSVTTAASNEVISNSPRVPDAHNEPQDNAGQGESKTVRFIQTPLLSTYLVALAVGELVSSEPVLAQGVEIRLVHVPGNEHLTGFALDAARECLTRLTQYFDLPYPYQKLDLVAVPDFEIGAMENAGAVFFRETLLLIDERTVTLAEKKRAAEVICHELAHMWYGNLVTMRWWDDLWLNEAFATWMAFDIVAKWRPEWKMWNDFGHARNSALHLDALDNTHPIYTDVRTPADATENFDLITYEKGAAVVRMLERYLGPATFQDGVRRYIKRHRESNTVAKDLWRALQEAATEDVERVVRAFIEEPGFPLLRMTRVADAKTSGEQLELTQERFRAHGPGKPSKAAGSQSPQEATSSADAEQLWAVPWVGRVGNAGDESADGSSALVRQLLIGKRARVQLPARAGFVYGNADEGGFFRPLHEPAEIARLTRVLPQLTAAERLGLLQHQWALVRAGYAELDSFLALMTASGDEPDADVLRALTGPCAQLVDDLAVSVSPELRTDMQRFVARVFEPAIEQLGMGTANDPASDDVRLRRAELAVLVGVIAEAPALEAALESHCDVYLHDRRGIDANLVASVLTIGARNAQLPRLTSYADASVSDPTPQERRRFRMALGEVRDPALVQHVLSLCLTERVPTQDVALLLARLLSNPRAQVASWEFIKAHWPRLRERMPAMLVSRLIEATPQLRDEAHRKDVAAFFAAHPVPTAVRALRQAQERFELDTAFRKRAAHALAQFLRAQDATA